MAWAVPRLAASNPLSRRWQRVERAKAVEGAVVTSTVANMMNWDHMRAFFRRAAALVAFVALLWAVHLLNWIIGYGLNPAFGLIPRHVSGLDGV
ncbi:MAG: hypothetical protein ABJO97_02195, partial [Roseibium sp.]